MTAARLTARLSADLVAANRTRLLHAGASSVLPAAESLGRPQQRTLGYLINSDAIGAHGLPAEAPATRADAANSVHSAQVQAEGVTLHPVGALTSKPYAFTARPWELMHSDCVDPLDGVGSNIRVDFKGERVMRILPRLNEDINEEWITDKIRFCYDGISSQRLLYPQVLHPDEADQDKVKLTPTTWEEALTQASLMLQGSVTIIVGNSMESEALIAAKDLADRLADANIVSEHTPAVHPDFAPHSAVSIREVEKADLAILVGINTRHEATMVNLALRRSSRWGTVRVVSLGATNDLTFPSDFLGLCPSQLVSVAEGTHPLCRDILKAKRPMFLYGAGVQRREDARSIVNLLYSIMKSAGKPPTSVVPISFEGNQVGAAQLYFGGAGKAEEAKASDTYYLLGVSDTSIIPKLKAKGARVIVQGNHGDEHVALADVILPGTTFVEKEATYTNLEGRAQRSARVTAPPLMAREDASVVRDLISGTRALEPFGTRKELRRRMDKLMPSTLNVPEPPSFFPDNLDGGVAKIWNTPIQPVITDFYRSDPLTRASKHMAKASAARQAVAHNFERPRG